MKSKKKLKKVVSYILLFTMIFSLFTNVFLLPTVGYADGGLQVSTGHTDEELVNKILGKGVEASDIKKTGNPEAFGIFSGDSSIVGFESGIVLSTGQAKDIVGPNKSDSTSSNLGQQGDLDLTKLAGIQTYDASVLEFNFVPKGDHISFQYVFSSEEYNEFANSKYNDVFAFFVNGKNVALIPNTNTPVSINTVNGGNPYGTNAKNPEYFRNNEDKSINIEMDGLTVVMSVSVAVNPGVKNSIKLAIADGADTSLDSNVFIKAGSLNDREVQPGKIELDSRKDYDVIIKRNGGSDGTASVDWKAKDENDQVVDYGTVTFGDGETEKVITVPGSTKTVELSNPKGGATIDPGSTSKDLEEIPNKLAPQLPTVLTSSVSNIQETTATLHGEVTFLGVPNPIQHGFVWSTTENPTVDVATKAELGELTTDGSFSSTITGLIQATTYYVRAYVTNEAGTSYGPQQSFTTTKAENLKGIIAEANKTKKEAEDTKSRYKKVGGEEKAEEYTAVETAFAELNDKLSANPQVGKDIEEATNKLKEATKVLEETVKAKELSNAITAANEAKNKAKAAKDRFTKASGNKNSQEYKEVETAQSELETALSAKPQDAKAIEEATNKLIDVTKSLEEASKVKELSNAVAAANEAKNKAKAAKDRFTKAGGNKTAQEYKAVETAQTELETALSDNPQDAKAIEEATNKLKEATKVLEEAVKAKELSNAITAANEAKNKAKAAKNRFTKAGGNKTAQEYKAVETAQEELETVLSANPQDAKAIEEATNKLKDVTKSLEEASKVKELRNAVAAANEAKNKAKAAKDRFTKASGNKNSQEYKAVETAQSELETALSAKPQDAKAIEEATNKLIDVTKSLEEASKAKELSNAVEEAKIAEKRAKTAQESFVEVGGKTTDEIYKRVSEQRVYVKDVLTEFPQVESTIQKVTTSLLLETDRLEELINKMVSNKISKEIQQLKDIEVARKTKEKIDGSQLDKANKKKLYGQLVDKVLDHKGSINLEKADDVTMLNDAINNSDKIENIKQEAYIRLAEKAINELSKPDFPKSGQKFQKQENKVIEQIINLVTYPSEKERLMDLHVVHVDTLSLTRDNAFTFNVNDSWESITSKFLLLSKGAYGSSITWKSSNSSIAAIKEQNTIVNRQVKDSTVILTAKVKGGNQTLEKTFLLVVKSNNVGIKVIENIKREVSVKNELNEVNPKAIQRINLLDRNTSLIINRIDKLVVDDSIIPSVTTDPISIYMPDDPNNIADELAIEIPYDIVQRMTEELEVRTDQGSLFLSKNTLQRMRQDGIDLFFRIVPLRQQNEIDHVIQRTKANELVKNEVNEVNGKEVKLLGTPREIETNYKGYETEIMLPLNDVLYDGINIEMLRVFIEHTDGEKKVVNGEIVFEDGKPVGIKFMVNKFSTFTIFEIITATNVEPIEESPGKDGNNQNESNPKPVVKDDTSTIDDKVENNSKQTGESLPNTATAVYEWLLIGFLLLSVGLISWFLIRKNKMINE